MAEGIGYSMKTELEPAVGEKKKVKVPVQPLPKTEAPKTHQEARKDAISKAIKKAKSKKKDASTSKTEQSPAEVE